jgi:acyl-CoA reductase-like NAD-dependent aldehyde dehydrogenase
MMAGQFERLDDLIRTINSSAYGLQAGVFTQNLAVIEKLYRELEVGGLVVNDVPTTRYDHQPYGGVKDSGHGREGVKYAMEEMTYMKFLNLSSQLPS